MAATRQIGLTADGRKVGRLRMADGDGGVLVEQQQRDGLAHDVAAPHHDRALAGDGNPVALQHLDDARGRAGARSRQPGHQGADIAGMEAVDVLFGGDGQQDALGIHLRRQGELHQDAIDIVARVELLHNGKEFSGRDGFGRLDAFRVNAEVFAGLDLVAHVDLGRGIVAHQHHREAGRTAICGQSRNAGLQLVLDLVAHGIAVKDQGHSF